MPLAPHAGELRVFALIGLMGTGLIAPPQEVTQADRYERRIIFDSDRDGNTGVYAMDPDGANPQRLTDGKQAGLPAWSPDGKKVAFGSNREGHFEIYVMDLDGSRLQRLTYTARENSGNPAWSPDGKRIAFDSSWDHPGFPTKWEEGTEIYVMDSDGRNVQRLSNTTGVANLGPVWSPDGKRIVFMSTRDSLAERWPQSAELYVMGSNGANVRRLTFNRAFDAHPGW